MLPPAITLRLEHLAATTGHAPSVEIFMEPCEICTGKHLGPAYHVTWRTVNGCAIDGIYRSERELEIALDAYGHGCAAVRPTTPEAPCG